MLVANGISFLIIFFFFSFCLLSFLSQVVNNFFLFGFVFTRFKVNGSFVFLHNIICKLLYLMHRQASVEFLSIPKTRDNKIQRQDNIICDQLPFCNMFLNVDILYSDDAIRLTTIQHFEYQILPQFKWV